MTPNGNEVEMSKSRPDRWRWSQRWRRRERRATQVIQREQETKDDHIQVPEGVANLVPNLAFLASLALLASTL
jgi:hypothetical protein